MAIRGPVSNKAHKGLCRGKAGVVRPEQCLTPAPRQAQDGISIKTKQNKNQNGHSNLAVAVL